MSILICDAREGTHKGRFVDGSNIQLSSSTAGNILNPIQVCQQEVLEW